VLTIAGLTLAGTQLPRAAAVTADKTVTLPATPGSNRVSYAGHAPLNNGQANLLFDDTTGACDGTNTALRDTHTILVKVPQQPAAKYDVLIRFEIFWQTPQPEPLEDMRLDLFGPDNKLVASSDGSQFSEGINLTSAIPGLYTMNVCAFQTVAGQNFIGRVTASTLQHAAFPSAMASIKPPTYKQLSAPKGVSRDAGEPSIGNNWKTGHTFFTSNTHEYDVAFNDKAGTSTWTPVNVNPPNGSNITSLDPIGFTDSVTGRSFVSQLFFVCSGAVFTDNDFASVTPSQGCGSGINGFDHQTFGGGPYPQGLSSLNGYPHAVYYCSQAQALVLGNATCARSDTGGLTFGPLHTVWNGACSGIHGHVRVSPKDGTVYLPNANCAGMQGVGVSTDGGNTWTVHKIPGSVAGTSDPSVSAGKDGTVYFGYADGTGRPKIAVSRDRGTTWSTSTVIGTSSYDIRNTEFSEVIAGDGDRAAFAFLGTPTPGSTQSESFGRNTANTVFTGGEWHMFVATTYDRGAHWTTVDTTPTDPVQRGCIWNAGGSNDCRNLLDFNDITVDKFGRIMVGFADGCVPPSVEPNNAITGQPTNNCVASKTLAANGYVNHGAIIRQLSGKGLFATYDGVLPGSGGTPPADTTPGGKPSGGGPLATTGSTPYLAGLGLLLVIAAFGIRRMRHRRA
jgi:hypothetical protein